MAEAFPPQGISGWPQCPASAEDRVIAVIERLVAAIGTTTTSSPGHQRFLANDRGVIRPDFDRPRAIAGDSRRGNRALEADAAVELHTNDVVSEAVHAAEEIQGRAGARVAVDIEHPTQRPVVGPLRIPKAKRGNVQVDEQFSATVRAARPEMGERREGRNMRPKPRA